jgi:CDP-glucose 4,6-dehydratase
VSRLHTSTLGDIRDLARLTAAIEEARPSLVIHLAAQALVRESYRDPIKTFSTNLLGTINLLEAVRGKETVEAVINVTTDKCYHNNDRSRRFVETDRLGGHDPYSSSKACSELATAAYRDSFLADEGIKLATVRSGNVIGGGDWSADRLVPDFLRSLEDGRVLSIRSPHAVRPWQHVLEPLSGYLTLGEKLILEGVEFAEAWNFGPEEFDVKPVSWVVDCLAQKFPTARWQVDNSTQPREADVLKLDSTKARDKLGWHLRWSLDTALAKTAEWHRAWQAGQAMEDLSLRQIESYETE